MIQPPRVIRAHETRMGQPEDGECQTAFAVSDVRYIRPGCGFVPIPLRCACAAIHAVTDSIANRFFSTV